MSLTNVWRAVKRNPVGAVVAIPVVIVASPVILIALLGVAMIHFLNDVAQ